MRRVVIENTSTKHVPRPGAVDALVAALEAGERQFAAAHGEYVFAITDKVRATGWRIVLLDNPDVADALGYHDIGPDGRPYARVFLDPIFENVGSWLTGDLSVSAVASHEFFEMLGDPAANEWVMDAGGVCHAREMCDAVQSITYDVMVDGGAVSLSDWLLPAWFNPFASGPYDKCDTLSAPFELAPGGYELQLEAGNVSQVFASAMPDTFGPEAQPKVGASRTAARYRWIEGG